MPICARQVQSKLSKLNFSQGLVYLKATRAPFLTATIVPVLLGSVIAWYKTQAFDWRFFWLVLSGIAAINIGTNLANDYFDHKSGNDGRNLTPTPFSGGSRVIQNGRIPARNILYFALSCFLTASIIGLYLNFKLKTNVVLVLGLIGVTLGYFYTALPLKIGYRGMGELVVGLCLGPLVVFGSYYVQAKTFDMLPVVSSIPVGILVLLILYINEFPDYQADKGVGKNTIVVLLGKDRAVYVYQLLLIAAYFWIIGAVFLKIIPLYCLITLLTVPLAFNSAINLKKNFNDIGRLLFSNAATIKLHLAVGLLLSLGFILDKVV